MSWYMIDVESDGPCPAINSMVSFGLVRVTKDQSTWDKFYREIKPITENYSIEALAVSNFTREQTLTFGDPEEAMVDLEYWIAKTTHGRPMLISDNNGFDAAFLNYYFWRFRNKNPFGHSSTNLGSLFKGIVRDTKPNFKFLRDTRHSHNALDDAIGNAEALVKLEQRYGLKIQLV